MLSAFFLFLGAWLGWWVRGTRAGSAVMKLFAKANEE